MTEVGLPCGSGRVRALAGLRGTLPWLAASSVVAFGVLLSLGMGVIGVPLGKLPEAILADDGGVTDLVVRAIRLPRAVNCVLAGGLLGASGSLCQRVAMNDLASPDVMGISMGASLGAVLLLTSGGPYTMLPIAALVGGVLAGVVFNLAALRGALAPRQVVLTGVGIAACCGAFISLMITRARIDDTQQALLWLVGSMNGSSWHATEWAVPACIVAVPAIILVGRPLQVLDLGDEVAGSLGIAVRVTRTLVWFIAIALACVAIAMTGPIAFVALGAPHIARRMMRGRGIRDVALSAIIGAALVLYCDLIGRTVLSPLEIPVGLVTPLLGGPLLLALLLRRGSHGRRWA